MNDDFIAARKRLGLDQEELSEYLGITPKQVSNLERGVSKPKRSILIAMAAMMVLSRDDVSKVLRAADRMDRSF